MNSFTESELREEILHAVKDLGFEKPTPIQAKTIPQLLTSNDDVIALAQTGTGKTAAFGLPTIHKTNIDDRQTQTIILCPTRELCMQIAKDLESYSKYVKGFSVVAVYGGANIETQIRALKKGAQVVVGTPGRTKDLIKRRRLILGNVESVILDEADEMLTMGFKEDLDAILGQTPDTKQTLLFSATMSKEIINITKKYMNNPVEISVAKENTTAVNVKHVYYMVNARDRYEVLKRIADINPKIYGIVFCRTRRETKEIANKLMGDGYNADALHGDLSQAQRDEVMGRFREGQLQLLVATDVAARGLDVNNLTHVVNFNLPDDSEVYVHRTGRTGRAGKSGIAITIVHTRESRKIREIEKRFKIEFTKELVPSGKDICTKQLYSLIDKIEKVEVEEGQIEPFLPAIYKKLEWLSREELIKHFVSAEFNRFLSYYKNARDINASSSKDDSSSDRRGRRSRSDRGRDDRGRDDRGNRRDRSDRKDRGERSHNSDKPAGSRSDRRRSRSNSSFSRIFINIGQKQDLNPTRLIGLVNDSLRSSDAEIGKIDILRKFSFFEVENSVANDLITALKEKEFEGVKLSAEKAQDKPDIDSAPRSKDSKKSDYSEKRRSSDRDRGAKRKRSTTNDGKRRSSSSDSKRRPRNRY